MAKSYQSAFRDEVARLARKEVKVATEALKKASAQYRRDVAELKRRVTALERRVAYFEGREKKRLEAGEAPAATKPLRFSPKAVKAHRDRLGLSAADYGRLLGVSHITVYNWEHGRVRPRQKQLESLAAIRGLGKREAARRLELLEG